MTSPCQYCMAGSDFGPQRAQLVLHEGQWTPWPLVAARPADAPRLLSPICPVCDTERYNAEAVPQLQEAIAQAQGSPA